MKITKKVLDFWENTTNSIEYYAREVLKKHLVDEGSNEQDWIFYTIDIDGGFPIAVQANTACHCHPEMKTVLSISKEDILNAVREDE